MVEAQEEGPWSMARDCDVEGCRKRARPGGTKCQAHASALLRHGVIPEIAFARFLELTFRVGAVDTDEQSDGEFAELLEEWRQAYILVARVHPRPPPLPQPGARLRRK